MNLDFLHEKLFEMLCLVDNICEKENIEYFIDSGTLIGAVREHDFIPWDDDADIVMTRNNYLKFRKVAKKYLPSNLRLIGPYDYGSYFYDFIPRIVNTAVPLRTDTDEDKAYKNYNNRASVDIFILDNAPDSVFLRKFQNINAKIIYCLAMSKRYAIHSEEYNIVEKCVTKFFSFMGRAFSLDSLVKAYYANLTMYSRKKTNYYIYGSIINCLLIYKKDLWKKRIKLDLHGKTFYGPAEYDNILRSFYGDYMTPVRDGFIVHAETDL